VIGLHVLVAFCHQHVPFFLAQIEKSIARKRSKYNQHEQTNAT
jgi:hypothetical protein